MFHFVLGLPWLVVVLRFILPLPWIWPAKALLAGLLLIASQQVLLNRISSGSVFAPEYPRPLIIVLNFLFGATLLLAVFQIALDVVSLVLALIEGRFPAVPPEVRYIIGLAAFGLAAFGVAGAVRIPPVKNVEISIRDLPEAFEGYRLLQLTDLHLSRLFPAYWLAIVLTFSITHWLGLPDRLVDLTRIATLRQTEERPNSIRYGALVTHAAFEDRQVADASNGLMPFIGSQIAYRAVRTRGTIGGAVALADPAADWLTTIIALEAEIALVGPNGRRVMPSTDFALGPYMTALEDAELIEAIVVPRRPASERWGHYKVARKTGEYAESMAIALIDKTRGKARLVVGATDGAPLVLTKSSHEIAAGKLAGELAAVIRQELADSGRDFPPEKLLLHCTTARRAVANTAKR